MLSGGGTGLPSSVANRLRMTPCRSRTTVICVPPTTGVDVKRALRIATLDASIGRKVSLQVSPREGPESAPKPPFRCEREIGLAADIRLQFITVGSRCPNNVRD